MRCSRPGLPAEPTLYLNGEDGPIVRDTFATLVFCEKKKPSLAMFYLCALTCRGKKMPDVATAEIEHSSVIMCHGQLMSEEFPVPKLHAWNGMLVQKVLKFRGENCRFWKLRANEDHMWFESSARLSALTSELLLNPPEYAPTIGVPPYPNLPSCAINDASLYREGWTGRTYLRYMRSVQPCCPFAHHADTCGEAHFEGRTWRRCLRLLWR